MSMMILLIVLLVLPVLILTLLLVFWKRTHPCLEKYATLLGAYRSLGWLLTIPLVLVGSYNIFLDLEDTFRKPDATLVFGRPSSPVFWVMNSSSKLVREPKYELTIFNLRLIGGPNPYTNLEIPTKITDSIRPNRALGPWAIQSVARKGSEIQEGNFLFGYGQVECPDCEHVHHYWIYVHVGVNGWYSEIPADETKAILKNLSDIIQSGQGFLEKISDFGAG
jgi:hypothetical protein